MGFDCHTPSAENRSYAVGVFLRWRQSRYQQLFLDIDGALMRFELEVWLVGETRSLENLNDSLQARGFAGVNIPLFAELYGGLP